MARTDMQGEMARRRKERQNAVQPDTRSKCDFIEKGHHKVIHKTEAMSLIFTKEDPDRMSPINKKIQKI